MAPENKYIVIIGLGRFGMALCHELSQEGAQVLAIDIDERNVRKAAEFVTQAIVADCSDADPDNRFSGSSDLLERATDASPGGTVF